MFPRYVEEREKILGLLDEGKTIEFIDRRPNLKLEYREIWTLVARSPRKVRVKYYRNGELLLEDIIAVNEHDLGTKLRNPTVEWRIVDES